MPELPEVEVLARHLDGRLRGCVVRGVEVHRRRTIRPDSVTVMSRALEGILIDGISRRAKYLVWRARREPEAPPVLQWFVHLGMTGRVLVRARSKGTLAHTAVTLYTDRDRVDFVDPRGFGRWTLDGGVLAGIGPEPLAEAFTADVLGLGMRCSRQAVKVRLLDQRVVAGVGNIYASEALFRARLSPHRPARQLSGREVSRLWSALREVLEEAIRFGSSVPLDFTGEGSRDGLFYHGLATEVSGSGHYAERLRVYDREGQPCVVCGNAIRRWIQCARSTYGCARCQR